VELAAQIFEEGDEFGSANRAVDELEIDIPEGDAGDGGELVPSEAVLQDRRLPSGCPGSNPMRPLAHTGLIYEDNGSALSGAVYGMARPSFRQGVVEDTQPEERIMGIAVLGIHIGKNPCSVVGLNDTGAVVLRRRVRRDSLVALVGKLPACVVAMEACCGAHHLGRPFVANGHDVRLMSPEYVRPKE
jgi:hypothetical protein